MSSEKPMPSEELLVEAIRWLFQLDMSDPRNRRPQASERCALGPGGAQANDKG